MRVFLNKLDGSLDAFLFEQLMEIIQKRRVVLVEQLFSFQILVWRNHDVIEVAIGDFQIIEIANVSLSGDLRAHSDVSNCC